MKDKNKNNDFLSFRNYYEVNVSSLTTFARRFVAVEVAEDIIQDLFLDTWNHLVQHRELPSRSYLFTAVRNKCLNIITREQVRRNYIETSALNNRLLGLDYYDSHEKQVIDREDMQLIYDEIEKLPEKCKQAFKMAYFEEKDNAGIAETLNISIRTVEHHLYLGLRMLRNKLIAKEKKDSFFLFFL